MRATDIIRNVLDLIDHMEGKDEHEEECGCGGTCDSCSSDVQQEPSRFKQILAMLNNPSDGEYANTPNEIVAGINSVTTDAGGGLNGPKHPADIRVKDPRGFE